MDRLVSILVTKPALAVLSSIRRHPLVWGLLVLILILMQIRFAEFILKGLLYIGDKLGEKMRNQIRAFGNWLFADPARLWWFNLILFFTAPVLGFALLLWRLVDLLRPETKLTIATEESTG